MKALTISEKIELVCTQSVRRVQRNVGLFTGRFPSYGNGQDAYHLTPNENWLAAFWSGLLWLVALRTDQPDDIAQAHSLIPSFKARLDQQVRLNHDLGFLYLLSARACWQLTGDPSARELALRAAQVLLGRYNSTGRYIQAWGELDDPAEKGRFIVDCMINLPLLYWASRETGNPVYRDAATAHARTSTRYLVRQDGSTYHTYFLNSATGDPIGPKTHQGYADDSRWTRGQSWAIYGFALAASWTGEPALLETAKRTADYYIKHVPLDQIVRWDFDLPSHEVGYPDSSADAIAVGGLLHLASLTGDERYREHALQRMDVLIEHAFDQRESAQGLLLHGSQHVPHGYGVDTYTIFGDYFFLEALMTFLDRSPDFWGPDAK